MHFGRGKPLVCPVCGDHHRIEHCRVGEDEPAPLTPLETPSHSGPYQGPVPVRVLPAGLSGEEPQGALTWKDKAQKGHEAQSRAAVRRNLERVTGRPRSDKCRSGKHLMSGDNLYISKSGDRHCRACAAEWKRKNRPSRAKKPSP